MGTPVTFATPTPYCVTPSVPIRINVIGDSLPTIRTAVTEICNGAPITLTSTVSKNIRWSTGDTSRTITVSTPGLYTLRSTASCGYGGSTDTIKIVDLSNFTPEIGPQVNSITVLNNSCVRTNDGYMELRAYPSAGNTVRWNDGRETARIFIFSAGTYSYTISRDGCVSRPRVFTLRDLSNIRVNASGNTLCNGSDSLRLIINERNLPGTYQWYKGSTPIAGATDSFYVARVDGNYSVKVAADTNCTIQSSTFVFRTQPDRIPEIGPQVNSVTVFNNSCVRTDVGYMELRAYPSAGETVTWNDGSSTTRKFIFSAGTYSYTISRDGCVSRPRIFTLRDLSNIRVNASGNTLCSGNDSLRLSISERNIPGTYQWYNGSDPIAGATDSFYVARVDGNYSVKVAADTNCTIQSSTFIFRTQPDRIPEIGPQVNSVTVFNNSCVRTDDGYMELRAYPSAGNTVRWNDGRETARIFIFSAGTYSYTISRDGCVSRPRIFTLRDLSNIRVNASGNTLCNGSDSLRLIINERNLPGTYQWYNGSTPIAGATDSFYVARVDGNYSVKVAADTNCTIQSPAWIVSSQNNFYTPTIIGRENRLIASLSDTSSITRYYFWYRNDSLVQSSTSNTYYPRTSNAGFSVRYALNAGGTCLSPMSSTYYYTAASTKFGNVQFSIVPNPASTDITITGIKPEKVRGISVINASGKTSAIAFNANAQSLEANISSLATGLYMLQIEMEDGSLALSKLVKK